MNGGDKADQKTESESKDQEERNNRGGGAGNTVRGRRSECHGFLAFPSGVAGLVIQWL